MKRLVIGLILIAFIVSGCATTRSYRPASPIPGEFIRAIGVGKSPKDAINPQQGDFLAREMAKTQAMNHLREKIQTIPVRGGLTVEQCIQRHPAIRSRVENIIQSAKIISDHMEKDGAWVEISIRYSDLKAACQ